MLLYWSIKTYVRMQNSKKPKIALQRSLQNLDGSKRSSTYCYDTIYKTKYFQIFLIEFDQKKFMIYQKPMLVFWKPYLSETSLPPDGTHMLRQIFCCSIKCDTSLCSEFSVNGVFEPGIPGYRNGFQRPTRLRWTQKNLKDIDSDSPDNEESESIIRISIA